MYITLDFNGDRLGARGQPAGPVPWKEKTMYLVRTEFMVRGGGAAEFEVGREKMAEVMKGQPGYLGQTLLHSYSHPAKYVVTSRYEGVEAAWAFGKSEKFAA